MNSVTVQAVYTGGVLKPAQKLDLPDGTTVEVEVKVVPPPDLAASATFGSLVGIWSDIPVEQVEKLERLITDLRERSSAKICALVS